MGNFLFIATTDEIEVKSVGQEPRITHSITTAARSTPIKMTFAPYLAEKSISTPTLREQFATFDPPSSSDEDSCDSFVYMSHQQRKPPEELEDTTLGESFADECNQANPPPPTWKEEEEVVLKYFDDVIGIEKILYWLRDNVNFTEKTSNNCKSQTM